MGKDDTHHGNANPDGKRQRLDDTVEQRTTFEEDMARIRSATNSVNNAASSAAPSGGVDGSDTVNDGGGETMGEDDGGERPRAIIPGHREGAYGGANDSDFPQRQQYQQQQGGESTLQQQQPSGESTLQQQPTVRHQYLQQQQAQQPHAHRSTGDNGSESEDEEGDGNNWLQHFTAHHTRVGENYQVADLPTAPSPAAPAASSSCVSPGASFGG